MKNQHKGRNYRQKINDVIAGLSNNDFFDVFSLQFFRRFLERRSGDGRSRSEKPDDPEFAVLDRQQVDVVDHLEVVLGFSGI